MKDDNTMVGAPRSGTFIPRVRTAAVWSLALSMACVTELPAREDTAFEDGADHDEAACPGHDHMVLSEPPTAYAIVGAADVRYRSDGLPLYESNPGANVAMFVDFDGGTYRRSGGALEDYGPASLDGDRSTFNSNEQTRILRAVTDLAANYAAYDVNVTTDPDARRRSPKWTWLLVTNDYGSRSGRAQIDDIGRKEFANGLAGTKAVLEPLSYEQPAYLLTHEFGHTFGLHHAGRYESGDFEEYSDYASGPRGAFMGGRGSQFDTYVWRELRLDDGSRQNPDAIIASEAGYRPDPGPGTGTTDLGGACGRDGDCRSGNCHEEGATDRCRPRTCSASDDPGDGEFCELDLCGPCLPDEGDCDSDDQCLGGAVCEQQDGDDFCRIPGGGSTPLGEACSADIECASRNCHEEGATDRCRPSTCAATDDPGDGEFCETTICGPCRVDEGDCDSDAQCLGDAVCEQQDGSDYCRAPSTGGSTPLGEACARDSECASGNCHEEGATDRCRPASCTSADSPTDGEFCETYICGPCRVDEGDCDSDGQCLGDAICQQRSGTDFCAAASCDDDFAFVDAQGYDCDGWDGYDCDDATARYGYSQSEEDAIFAACPRTCGTCS